MSRTSLSLAMCALSTLTLAAVEPMLPELRDEQDFVFLERSRPVRLRLHLLVDGQPFRAHWDEIMSRLFAFLDADGNGRLSAKEAEHAPSVMQLRSMIQSKPDVEADEAPTFSELADDPKSGATLQQLKSYYHRVGVAPWQVDWFGRIAVPDHLDDAILSGFGSKSSVGLTSADFKNAQKLIQKFDADNDETVSALELSTTGYAGGFGNAVPFTPHAGPFALVDPSENGRNRLALALLERYDANKDGRLTNAEVTFSSALFVDLDRNRDTCLDAVELVAWLNQPSDLTVALRLDGSAGESVTTLQGSTVPTAKKPGAAGVQMRLPDDLIEVVRSDALRTRQERLQNTAALNFMTLDRNGDGVLDNREVYQPPFEMVALLRLADRNGDDKLSRAEFQAFLDVQKKIITRCVIITLVERGRSLFDFLDADRDHRLSRRELAGGFERMKPWADGQRQEIERGRLPRQYQVIVSQGPLPRIDSDPGAAGAGRPELRLRGPLWFRKMDRNADGDVSAMEFLGTPEQFRRLDADGDELIGLSEAEAAGKK